MPWNEPTNEERIAAARTSLSTLRSIIGARENWTREDWSDEEEEEPSVPAKHAIARPQAKRQKLLPSRVVTRGSSSTLAAQGHLYSDRSGLVEEATVIVEREALGDGDIPVVGHANKSAVSPVVGKASTGRRKKASPPPPISTKDFLKTHSCLSWSKYLSQAPDTLHRIAYHRDAPLSGVRAFFVTAEKSFSKAMATHMENVVRLGGSIHESFRSPFTPSKRPQECTTHIIVFSSANSPSPRFKDVLRCMSVAEPADIVGREVASGQPVTERKVWVVNSQWLVECCKMADVQNRRPNDRAKKLQEMGFLVECDGDKERRKSFIVQSRSNASISANNSLADFAMPGDSQLSTAPFGVESDMQHRNFYQSPGLHLPDHPEASQTAFDDIAVEIDMARNDLDVLIEDDEDGSVSDIAPSPERPVFVIPSKRTEVIESDECPSDEELAVRDAREREKWEITKEARRQKRLTGEKYRCDTSSALGASRDGPNERAATIFDQLAAYHERSKMPNAWWRVKGYRQAAGVLRNVGRKIETLEDALKLRGIGEKIATKLVEIVQTGKSTQLENKSHQDVVEARFTRIYGVGPTKALEWINAGMETLDDVRNSESFGIMLSDAQKLGLRYHDDLQERMPREEVARYFRQIQLAASSIDMSLRVECMGSFRRGQPDCGDIDILLTRDTSDGKDHSGLVQRLVEVLYAQGLIRHTLSNPEDWKALDAKWMGLLAAGNGKMRRIDILGVPFDELGAALIYFTGNDIFNRSLRLKARHLGYSLNQRGLFENVYRDPKTKQKKTEGRRVASRTEQEIFDKLGTKWRPPHERLP